MGVTAVRGADTPRYNPRTPSFAIVLESIPKTEAPAVAPPVCIRTLIRSSGWPTNTQHAPPTPPEMKDLSAERDDDLGSALQHSCCEADSVVSILVVMVLLGISVAVDMILFEILRFAMDLEYQRM